MGALAEPVSIISVISVRTTLCFLGSITPIDISWQLLTLQLIKLRCRLLRNLALVSRIIYRNSIISRISRIQPI